jgi:hypothetical protein
VALLLVDDGISAGSGGTWYAPAVVVGLLVRRLSLLTVCWLQVIELRILASPVS